MKILVTGAAGFIGMHASLRLLEQGHEVVGLDNLNDYYEVSLKEARLARLLVHPQFRFTRMDVADTTSLAEVFAREQFERVLHLAAQAGVRYSLKNPHAYVQANLVGFMNILEGCRHGAVKHLVYASSSSVYGGNKKLPYSEHDDVSHPVSLYAATKRANELMAHAYAHMYGLPSTGLRFFTVYGPWGRPDMALFLFTRAMLEGKPIQIFNHGRMIRDFTYVDDIVEGISRVLERPPRPDPEYDLLRPDSARSDAPFRLFNIGNSQPIQLMTYIETLEKILGRTAEKSYLPMQDGDVAATHADTSELGAAVGFQPQTTVAEGVGRFIDWYRSYYKV